MNKNKGIKFYYSVHSDQAKSHPWSSIIIEIPTHIQLGEIETYAKEELLKKGVIGDSSNLALYGAFSESYSPEDAEASLQRLFLDRQRLASIVQSSEDAILGIDLEGNITSWNTSAEKMFGYQADEIIGKSDLLMVPAERQSDFYKIINAIKMGSRIDHYETERITKDGRKIMVSVSISPIHNSKGIIIGASKISRDITAQKKVEQELVEAKNQAEALNEAKTSFIANVSHEIRTPIGVMMGFAELLESGALNEEEKKQAIEKILKNGQLVSTLVNEILDLSKVESGKMQIESIPTDVETLIKETVSGIKVLSKEKGLDLEVKLTNIPKMVHTDPVRLRQILNNILGNAVKFTKRGFVRLECEANLADDNSLRLAFTISDSGIGISTDQQKKLFTRYIQADSSVTRKFGGVGLGLALSRELAKALGGNLTLESSTTGQGTVFKLEIKPLAHSELSQNLLEQKKIVKDKNVSGKHILIIDDSKDNCLYLKKILEKRGAIVATAENGREGSAKALSEEFDLILMDIQMPVMDGYSTLKYLQSKNYTQPIIALTAGAMKQDQEKCFEAGFTGFLTKPVKTDVLLEEITQKINQ